MDAFDSSEEMKHKKKKSKSMQKSNHKHEYVLKEIEVLFKFGSEKSENDRKYYVHLNEYCVECGKLKVVSNSMLKSEYEDLTSELAIKKK